MNKEKHKYYFYKKYFTAENIRTLFFCSIILVLIINSLFERTFTFSDLIDSKLLFSIILLFFSDHIAILINRKIQNKYEDFAKLTDDYTELVNKYQLSNLIKYDINDFNLLLPYELIGKVRENDVIIINDTNEKMYDLPKQVCDNSSYIYEVHKGSVVYNNINIRLDDIRFENHNITLFTSRTHYFDSLITNRACDFVLKDGRSIREIFEPGPYIKPLNLSKMSNHIGFNGLVITSDGYIPFIKRSRDVSVAKGIIATSISASIKTKYAIDKNNFDFTISGLANSIRHEIYDELNIDLCNFSDDDLINGIKFFYRDLIECGKPQFFVYYNIPYTADNLTDYFYKNDASNDEFIGYEKEVKMMKDGSEILFFKLDELMNSSLLPEKNNNNSTYKYDKIMISGITYDISPGVLLSLQLIKSIMH